MNEHKREPLTFVSLALALANDYSRLFVINADDDSYVEYSPSGDNKELVPVSHGEDFFTDVRRDVREQVWPEDQEYFLDAFQKENVVRSLKDGGSFSLTYRLDFNGVPRYFFLKTIRATDRSIVIGVQDIDVQKRRELKKEEVSRTYSEIAESLASLYEVIYYVDIATGHFTIYRSSDSFAGLGLKAEGEDFFEMAKKDIELVLHPDDRDAVVRRMERDSLIDELRANGSVNMTYRQILDGRIQYVKLLAFFKQGDAERLVIGVRNVDQQVRKDNQGETYSQIAGALASRYEVIYYINSDTNEYTQYSASAEYARLGTTKQGTDFFADALADIKIYIHRQDVDRLLREMAREHLISTLDQNGSLTLTYRQMLGSDYQYMNMAVVRPKNDTHHIVVGVFNVDSQMRRELSMQQQNQAFSNMAMALALQYEVIYYVSLINNEYTEYSASEKYTRLEIGAVGKDFFAETAENMKKDIYPEDLPMMSSAMTKENLIKRLEASGKTFLDYRLILDGRPQYVSLYAVRPPEDKDHIIIAVANVDAAKRMELEYRSAVDMANRDALTGVKNKRAYAQAEMELDEMIAQGICTEFSIVICDINGLKNVNDTKGHKAGDEFIRSGCRIICDIFDHSPVFRIGGDEFAIIVKGRDHAQRSDLLEKFDRFQETQIGKGLVTIACGISDFDPQRDIRVQDVFERADNSMYVSKKRFKKEHSMN